MSRKSRFASVAATLAGLCVAVAALSLPAAAAPEAGSTNPFQIASRTAVVFIVPLDEHSRQLLNAIVPTLARWLPAYQQLSIVPNNPRWTNKARDGERNADMIEKDLLSQFRQAQGPRPVFLMAVTSEALYTPAAPQLNFTFGTWLQPYRGQYSSAYGTLPMRVYQPERGRSRLTEMMLRYIGQIACIPYLRPSSDPRSVEYEPLLSTADLDRMAATLPAHCRRR